MTDDNATIFEELSAGLEDSIAFSRGGLLGHDRHAGSTTQDGTGSDRGTA